MSDLSIGDLVGTVSLNDQFSGPISKVAATVGLSGESFKAMAGFVGRAAGAIVGATSAVVALGIHGAEVADVTDAFDQLTGAAGSTAAEMLGALQQGTLNTISNFDLMKASNGVLASGLIKSADDMRTLAAGAKLLADRTGGDTAEAFGTLTAAMATGRAGALKQLGVVIDVDSATQQYADSLGRNVKGLSDHEVATAKSRAVLNGLKEALDANGPAARDFGDRITQGKVAVQNLVDNVAVAVANSPTLAVAMDAIADAIQSAFGGNNQQAVQALTGYVDKFAIFLVQTARVGVDAARFITDAFNGTKLIFNLVLESLFTNIGKAASTLADLGVAAQALPTVGALFGVLGLDMRKVGDTANSLALGFKQQGDAAYDSAVTATVAYDKVDALLLQVQTSMEGVSGSQVKVSTTARDAAKAHADAAAAAKHYSEVMAGLSEDNEKWRDNVEMIIGEVDSRFLGLLDSITIANQTGIDARLMAIDFAEQEELAGLARRQEAYGFFYDGLVALTQEKYQQMTDAVIEANTAQIAAASAKAFTEREIAAQTLAEAIVNYNALVMSGQASFSQIGAAYAAMMAAQDRVSEASNKAKMNGLIQIAGQVSTLLLEVFGKNKAAAIAAAVIDAAAAFVKALASAPPPFNYILAGAVAATALVHINKIRSTNPEGFAQGTQGMGFEDFGRESRVALHGQEAVVNRRQGGTLADMVLEAVTVRDNETAMETRGLREDLRRHNESLVQKLREAGIFGRATASA